MRSFGIQTYIIPTIPMFYEIAERRKKQVWMADTTKAKAGPMLGVVLMSLAMLTIPLVDGQAKYLSSDYSPLFISWARYVSACLIVLPIVFIRFGKSCFPSRNLGAHSLRTVFLVTSMTLYFLSISRVPLATANTAFFIGPVIAVVLSVFVLKERFTLKKGVSLGLGVCGTLFILRPGGSADPGVLMAFGSGFFFALYMLATRQASKDSDPFKTLAFQCVGGAILLLPQGLLYWSVIAIEDLIFFIGMGLFSSISHILSITAFRYADASTLAPLVYVELIATTIVGYLVFSEIPGSYTIGGAILIVLAGLVLLAKKPERMGVV